jgi:hypothetical protein
VPRSKNDWSYTSTPQYTFMAWCLVKRSTETTLPLSLSPEYKPDTLTVIKNPCSSFHDLRRCVITIKVTRSCCGFSSSRSRTWYSNTHLKVFQDYGAAWRLFSAINLHLIITSEHSALKTGNRSFIPYSLFHVRHLTKKEQSQKFRLFLFPENRAD